MAPYVMNSGFEGMPKLAPADPRLRVNAAVADDDIAMDDAADGADDPVNPAPLPADGGGKI